MRPFCQQLLVGEAENRHLKKNKEAAIKQNEPVFINLEFPGAEWLPPNPARAVPGTMNLRRPDYE